MYAEIEFDSSNRRKAGANFFYCKFLKEIWKQDFANNENELGHLSSQCHYAE